MKIRKNILLLVSLFLEMSTVEVSAQGLLKKIEQGLDKASQAVDKVVAPEQAQTIANSTDINQIIGEYRYEYPDGASGYAKISKADNNKVEFEISTETSQGNTADIQGEAILSGNSITYTDDDLGLKITFYKDFLEIEYTKEPSFGYFGLNATLEGKYSKVK